MFFSKAKKINTTISALLCVTILAVSFAFSPITYTGKTSQVHAITVTEVGPNLAANKFNVALNTITSAAQNAFYIKEFTLDGIASGLAKMVVKSMTQSILNWINSGFQGSPAFVTDLKQFMLDRADQVVGEFIYNDPSLNFLCSPFQLDVKIALATTYQQNAHGGLDAQCTLSDVTDNVEGFLNGAFNEGGWDSWFEVTQNPVNTPTGAYLAAEGEMYARIIDEQGRTIKELDWGDGFLSFKVCSDTDVASGKQTNCDITTPGTVIANQINKSLGAGQDALIEADEINEIIGALFAQLAQKAITGINGLLGLGGSSYSSNSYGESGTDSYLDALGKEETLSESLVNPFIQAIEDEEKQITLQNNIVNEINKVETQLQAAKNRYPNCFNISLPDKLDKKRQEGINKILLSTAAVSVLNTLSTQYENTKDPEKRLIIVEELRKMENRGQVVSILENVTVEFYLEIDLPNNLKALRAQINVAERKCED